MTAAPGGPAPGGPAPAQSPALPTPAGTEAPQAPTQTSPPRSEPGPVVVPRLLLWAGAWAWRLLAVGAVLFFAYRFTDGLTVLLVPVLTSFLVTALLNPLVRFLRGHGMSRGWSTLVTMLVALVVFGLVVALVVDRAVADYGALVDQANKVIAQVETRLTHAPFNLRKSSVDNVGSSLSDFINKHKGAIASGAVTAGRTVADFLTGLVLTIFLVVFMVLDGRGMWSWFVNLMPVEARDRADGAGTRAWQTLTGYVGGQFIVAIFQGVVIGVTLAVLGNPLIIPLAVLVFVGSFVPIIGAVGTGAFAVLVELVSGGVVRGAIVLGVLVVANQVESHLLQPLVVGRTVHLHPVAIAVTLTGAALIAGLPGAIFGVPIVASINAAAKFLGGREDVDGHPLPQPPPPPPPPDEVAATESGYDSISSVA